MGDWIDELVDWQLEQRNAKRVCGYLCPNCNMQWHGLPQWTCPGSHVVVSKCKELLPYSAWRDVADQLGFYEV